MLIVHPLRHVVWLGLVVALAGCRPSVPFDASDPARGPGELVPERTAAAPDWPGGADVLPAPAAVTPPADGAIPDCGPSCIAMCEGAGLENPVNKGLCRSLWGVGLEPRPIERTEACRRLFVDMAGRLPSLSEVDAACPAGKSWGEIVSAMIDSDEFVEQQRRRAADDFLYNTEVVSVERIYDMDNLVARLARGEVPYDLFAEVAATHPVVTRRFATAGDTVEAVFRRFLGRPPFVDERSDMARLYTLWYDHYYDHPALGMRLPDAFIRFRCLTEEGEVDDATKGECASVLWGYNELILTPDIRATADLNSGDLILWSGLLTADEWKKLQIPGRILATLPEFWVHAVDRILERYLGYELGRAVPEVREELVRYFLAHDGDIRAVHYAVATSIAYLQSHQGPSATDHRWTWGPMKQIEAESWIDSVAGMTGYDVSDCDARISDPDNFLESRSIAGYALLKASDWAFDDEGQPVMSYANLARSLGGCPANDIGGRFKIISILTTATQLDYVNTVCNPGNVVDDEGTLTGASVRSLLPSNITPAQVVDADVAQLIAQHQYRKYFGRKPTLEELTSVREAGDQCALTLCDAEGFARPLCYALLSSAEMLFQ